MPDTGKSVSIPRLVIHQSISSKDQNGFAKDVRAGLTATPKTLKPKYLYDALGSLLFEAICLLPEYYLTRAETEIFERRAAEIVAQLLAPIRGALRPGDGLLLGADLKKSRETLEAAYNDALNLTEAFSRNLLLRINRELNADFDLRQFKHRAFFNEDQSRIEIHLVSG